MVAGVIVMAVGFVLGSVEERIEGDLLGGLVGGLALLAVFVGGIALTYGWVWLLLAGVTP